MELKNQIAAHAFNPLFAQKYGLPEAILIAHFQFWIQSNINQGINFHEGRTWTFQTREEIASHYIYFTADQVRRLTDSLVEQGVLIKGNFNDLALDKTIWYAFKNQEMFTIGKSASSTGKSARPIPHTKLNISSSLSPKPSLSKNEEERDEVKPKEKKSPLKKDMNVEKEALYEKIVKDPNLPWIDPLELKLMLRNNEAEIIARALKKTMYSNKNLMRNEPSKIECPMALFKSNINKIKQIDKEEKKD